MLTFLLYSCETGKGLIGKSFIARLAEFSGADVAASTDLTGGANTLGDWDLEATVGKIDAQARRKCTSKREVQRDA